MTEQEAGLLAARLTRVWEPTCASTKPTWTLTDELFCFDCRTVDHMLVTFEQYLKEERKDVEYQPGIGNQYSPEKEWPCRCLCVQLGGNTAPVDLDPAPSFNEHYLPLFRRNCWLSGFNIEASAHEKAEWIEGFTREEIEAWNLKI